MVIYLIFFSIIELITFLRESTKKSQQKYLSLLLFLFLFLFMGLRYGIGQDYFFTYVPIYEQVLSTGTASNVEVGYLWLNQFLAFFFSDYSVLFLITAAIFVGFSIGACNQYNASWILMIYIFFAGGFYLYSFNVMRQCIVISIFYYSLRFIREKKLLLYLLFNGLAACLHITALLFLPLYFILDKRYKTWLYFALIVIGLALRLIAPQILGVVLAGTKYENYLIGYYQDSSKLINVSQILNVFVFLAYLKYIKKNNNDKKGKIFLNIHFAGLFATIFMGVVPLVFRVTTMFYLVQFLSVPYLIENYCSKKYKLFFIFLAVGIYGLLLINTLMTNGNNIIPYKTIFER